MVAESALVYRPLIGTEGLQTTVSGIGFAQEWKRGHPVSGGIGTERRAVVKQRTADQDMVYRLPDSTIAV